MESNKLFIGIIAGVGLAGWLLWWLHHCPVCPRATQNTTVIHDTVTIHDTVAPRKIRLTKITPKHGIGVQPVTNCDSIIAVYESDYTYSIPLKDSIMTGSVDMTIGANIIKEFKTSFTYFLPHTVDSVFQTINVPSYRNTFTVGAFVSKHSSGVAVGYRAKRVHGALGYDLTNKSPVVVVNWDLR